MGSSAFLKTRKPFLRIFLFMLLGGFHNFPCAKSCHPSIVMLSTLIGDDENLEGPDSCKENHVYFNETKKCYLFTKTMQDNPCGPNMKFEQTVENPKIGRCDCDTVDRPLYFNQRMKQCYFILTQGPCQRGEWIDLVNGSPKCVHNPCAAAINVDHNESTSTSNSNSAEAFNNGTGSSDEVKVQDSSEINENIVIFNGHCTLLDSKCKPINSKRTGKVQFTKGEPHPECVLPKLVKFAVGAIESSRCPHNTYRTIDGRGCQAPVYFDFDF